MKSKRIAATLLIAAFAAAGILDFSGCVTNSTTGKSQFNPIGWIQEPSTQASLETTLAVVAQMAEKAALDAVLSLATNAADGQLKGNALDGIASGLYANMGSIVTAQDLSEIVTAWAPNDGAAYTALAGDLAQTYSAALAAKGKPDTAAVVQSIAQGLNSAAAQEAGAGSP